MQRAMSKAELDATRQTGLVRGGRLGPHYVSGNVNSDALRARLRLALPQTPEARVTLRVPKGAFSNATRVHPSTVTATTRFVLPGGGMERVGYGNIPAEVVDVWEYER